MSDNNTLIYRVRGWDNWERQSGKLVLHQPASAARRKGTGLQAEYFANHDLSGEPRLRRRDPNIWFGPMWGDHREVAATKFWFSDAEPFSPPKNDRASVRAPNRRAASAPTVQPVTDSTGLSPGNCSARWTGFFEPPLGEDF